MTVFFLDHFDDTSCNKRPPVFLFVVANSAQFLLGETQNLRKKLVQGSYIYIGCLLLGMSNTNFIPHLYTNGGHPNKYSSVVQVLKHV